MAMAALMGADAFVSPVATSFSGSAVATRVSEPAGMHLCYKIGDMKNCVLLVIDVQCSSCGGLGDGERPW